MADWYLKTRFSKLLMLISCLAMALPGIAGPGLCQDNYSHCSATRSDYGTTETQSPCFCCTAQLEEKPSCCQSTASLTLQQSCSCQTIPPAAQPCSLIEKTEQVVSSHTLCQHLASFAIPTALADAGWYNIRVAPPSGPELLRSVILLI